MSRLIMAVTGVLLLVSCASAGTIKQRDGWVVIDSNQPYAALVQRLEAAVKTENMGLVTSASASEGAKAAGVTIPGNRIGRIPKRFCQADAQREYLCRNRGTNPVLHHRKSWRHGNALL